MPSGPQEYQNVYYAEWEREYGVGGSLLGGQDPPFGAPFPAPTPYSITGLNYTLGQRVEVWPFHVQVSAHGGAVVALPGVPPTPSSSTWSISPGTTTPPRRSRSTTPSGCGCARSPHRTAAIVCQFELGAQSRVHDGCGDDDTATGHHSARREPHKHPDHRAGGMVKTVEITFAGQPGYTPLLPTATTLAGTPTATAAPTATPATPTPNTDLRTSSANELAVTWTDTEIKIGPRCGDPGAMTDWDGNGWGHEAALAVQAPPGAGRIVQIALNQVGKPYVWGAKGPEQFDCSGLTQWSYAQIGIPIPTGTAGQWPRMRSVSPGELQPGDLIFFDVDMNGHISHVGHAGGRSERRWDMGHGACGDAAAGRAGRV